jgi:3-phenylpropionate/trans-cinnamate dioxygenase ferredoxin component
LSISSDEKPFISKKYPYCMEKICSISDVAKGTMKGFTINGKKVLVANVEGRFYAMDALCSHMKGYLPDGKLENNIVICPVHGSQFDVTTGKVVKSVGGLIRVFTGSAKDMQVYKTEAKEGIVYIEI